MAKKPMTKSQIVGHFAKKFDLSKKLASEFIEEMANLAVSETKKSGSSRRVESCVSERAGGAP